MQRFILIFHLYKVQYFSFQNILGVRKLKYSNKYLKILCVRCHLHTYIYWFARETLFKGAFCEFLKILFLKFWKDVFFPKLIFCTSDPFYIQYMQQKSSHVTPINCSKIKMFCNRLHDYFKIRAIYTKSANKNIVEKSPVTAYCSITIFVDFCTSWRTSELKMFLLVQGQCPLDKTEDALTEMEFPFEVSNFPNSATTTSFR